MSGFSYPVRPRRAWLMLCGLALALLGAGRLPAQAVGEECEADSPAEASCVGASVGRLRSLYGLPTIARLEAEGVEASRAFLVSGRQNVGALSFTRRPGEAPRATFQLPPFPGERLEPVTFEVPPEIWRQIRDRSIALFEDASSRPRADGAPTCFHSWSYFVEARDPRPPAAAGMAAGSDNRCSYTIETAPYSNFLLALAVDRLPGCPELAASHFPRAVDRIGACARLTGHRAAAAAIVNAAGNIAQASDQYIPPDRSARPALHPLFAADAVLQWQMGQVTGRDAVARQWRRLRSEHRDARLAFTEAEGFAADRGALRGFLYFVRVPASRDAPLRYFNAPLVAHFVRDAGGRFRLTRVTIGVFEPQRS